MIGKTNVCIYVIACLCLMLFGTAGAVSAPAESIESTISTILDTLKDPGLSAPAKKQERRDKIRALIKDRFDFEEMARRSLARHWKKRTDAEKKEFVSIFSELLEESYIGKIENYTDEKITYDKEVVRKGGKYAVVSTMIVTENVDIPIDYKVMLKTDKW
ncbi:MAG TPA: ABC transporter substrate-binding protein, partial [Nitrospirae bacterium]|nr:ABC transporter substrate-binding protein [Nitrospirota bacterium]